MLLLRSCDLSDPAQHTWTCKLAGACLLATCPYYVVPIPKVYVYVLFLLLIYCLGSIFRSFLSETPLSGSIPRSLVFCTFRIQVLRHKIQGLPFSYFG